MIRHPTLAVPRLGDVIRALLPAFLVEFLARHRSSSSSSSSSSSPSSCSPSSSSRQSSTKRVLSPTAYLDGLRGLAALAVFGYHYTDYNHKYFHSGSGLDPENGSSVLQLPFVRLVHAGRPMVHLFFVISGLALSLRPLHDLHAGRVDAAHSALASAAFRRPIRLLGPCLVLTFSLIFWCRAGYFHHYIDHQETLGNQVSHWARDFFGKVAWPWDWEHGERPRYNVHLWTIPIELSHSYLLFFVLLLVSKLRAALRPVAVLGVMAYSLKCGRWAVFDFMAGALLADLHLWEQHGRDQEEESTTKGGGGGGVLRLVPAAGRLTEEKTTPWSFVRLVDQAFTHAVLLVTGYIMSWPSAEPFPASYKYLLDVVPRPYADHKGWEQKADFWFALCGVAAVWAAGRTAWARAVLESRFAQHMGRVSFAFYILQHPELNVLQPVVMGAAPQAATADGSPAVPGWGLRGWPGVETWTQRVASWVVGWVLIGAVLWCIADVFTRVVDLQCVRLARWAEERLCVGGGSRSEAALHHKLPVNVTKELEGVRIS